jgi:diguanylate cyclase (GGDEF)-like protein
MDAEPTSTQLLAIIRLQTEIAKLGLDLHAVMTLVAQQAQVITCATGAVVELAEGDEMVYRAVSRIASGLLGLRLSRTTNLSGLCVASAASLSDDETKTDSRVDREACQRVGIRSMVVVPLIHQEEAVGALKVLSPEPRRFGENDLQVLSLMSELIAASMYHAAKFGTDELFRRATTNPLTGLANRALFLDRLRCGIAESKRDGRHLGVMMVDIDGLKPINDHYGHGAGDAALKEIANRLLAETRRSDTVARLGGDEFALVLSTIENCETTLRVAQRMGDRCRQPFRFEGRTLAMGASIGVALCPEDGDQPDGLLETADRLMYAAKRAKKSAERGKSRS